jgi:L-erythro-3,5-diaminohexanoate dehydrogenase
MEYGFHRVIEPKGVIPQAAYRLDNTPRLKTPYEILLRVNLLNLDSTSMRQIKENYPSIEDRIFDIVNERGKMHNPETNSGGVLTGYVFEMGEGLMHELWTGDCIIPVVSLSTIPLNLTKIKKIQGNLVHVDGTAVLFQSLPYALMPEDFSLEAALEAIDISSIVPQVYRSIKDNQTMLVIGTGNAGITAMAAARKKAPHAYIIGMDLDENMLNTASNLGYANKLLKADATNPEYVLHAVEEATSGKLCDLVINCVNVPNTEASSILAAKQHGTVMFFSMATQFNKAALGTDATGKDVYLLIGNGVSECQDKAVFDLLRKEPKLRSYFERHNDKP